MERCHTLHGLSTLRRSAYIPALCEYLCLSKAETAKLNELRVELMYEQFAPDGMRGDEMREIKKKCENNPKQEEANFKTALHILEAEGNEEVARSRAARAARGKFKKASKLIGRKSTDPAESAALAAAKA